MPKAFIKDYILLYHIRMTACVKVRKRKVTSSTDADAGKTLYFSPKKAC